MMSRNNIPKTAEICCWDRYDPTGSLLLLPNDHFSFKNALLWSSQSEVFRVKLSTLPYIAVSDRLSSSGKTPPNALAYQLFDSIIFLIFSCIHPYLLTYISLS